MIRTTIPSDCQQCTQSESMHSQSQSAKRQCCRAELASKLCKVESLLMGSTAVPLSVYPSPSTPLPSLTQLGASSVSLTAMYDVHSVSDNNNSVCVGAVPTVGPSLPLTHNLSHTNCLPPFHTHTLTHTHALSGSLPVESLPPPPARSAHKRPRPITTLEYWLSEPHDAEALQAMSAEDLYGGLFSPLEGSLESAQRQAVLDHTAQVANDDVADQIFSVQL